MFETGKFMANRFITTLGLLSLLYVFLTVPFMVECIRTDGQRLIEIIGSDPCNEFGVSFHHPETSCANEQIISVESVSGSVCIDRFTDNPTCTRQATYRNTTLKLFLVQCESAQWSAAIHCSYNPIPAEPPSYGSVSILNLNLRI